MSPAADAERSAESPANTPAEADTSPTPELDADLVFVAPTPSPPMTTSTGTSTSAAASIATGRSLRPAPPSSATRQATRGVAAGMARARETAARQSLARRLQPDVLQTLETLAALDGTTVEALVSEMELDNTTVREEYDTHYTLEPLPVAGYPQDAVRHGLSPPMALHFADVVAMPQPVRGIAAAPQRRWTTFLGSGLCSMRGVHHVMCPCMVFADLHTRVKYNTTRRGPDECTLCVHFALLWPGIPIVLSSVLSFLYLPAAWAVWLPMHGYVSWFSAPTRTKLRHKYAIDRFRVPLFGVPLSDGCLHTWCMACSLLQEGNELNEGALPTWNTMGSAPPEPRRPWNHVTVLI